MKTLLFLCCLITCVFSIYAKEPFVLPAKTKVINQDKSGKTWQMNATLNVDFEKAKKQLSECVEKSNFKLKHEIILDQKEQKVLLSWMKGKDNLLMMIWRGDENKTFFSWGVYKE